MHLHGNQNRLKVKPQEISLIKNNECDTFLRYILLKNLVKSVLYGQSFEQFLELQNDFLQEFFIDPLLETILYSGCVVIVLCLLMEIYIHYLLKSFFSFVKYFMKSPNTFLTILHNSLSTRKLHKFYFPAILQHSALIVF